MQDDNVPKIQAKISGNLSHMKRRYNQQIKEILKIIFSLISATYFKEVYRKTLKLPSS